MSAIHQHSIFILVDDQIPGTYIVANKNILLACVETKKNVAESLAKDERRAAVREPDLIILPTRCA
jgi:hypothetical protein